MTTYDYVQSNKRKTVVLIGVFTALVLAIGWLIDQMYTGGQSYFFTGFAVVYSGVSALVSYYAGDKIALATSGAQQVTGAITGVGIALTPGAYSAAAIVRVDTGEVVGIDTSVNPDSVPIPFRLAFDPATIDQDADYDSPNFLWFKARYPRFVYVDRIAVAAAARGRGHARSLYGDLFGAALAKGHKVVVCEVNSDPPNPASDAFHAALGFSEVGQAAIHGGKKTVRYFARPL